MSQIDDPFYFESGLKDDFVGTITDEWFGKSEGVDSLRLFLKIRAEDGEEIEQRYNCGSDWQSFDGGKTAEHPTKKFFNKNSRYATLCTAAFACEGVEPVLRERSSRLGNLGPRAAEIWKDLTFHWWLKTETGTFNRGENAGQAWESNTLLPDIWIPNGAASAATATAPATAPAAATSDPFQGVPTEMRDQIILLASQKDFGDWVTAVVQLPGAAQQTTLMKAVSTEAFYNSLK